jgi:3-oxoacyl-[acyl-carrier protein] reductase
MQLPGKTVVITGAGRGIGRAIATRLAQCGAGIALIDLDPMGIEATASLCESHGATARRYVANVAVEGDVCRAMDSIVGDFGRIDVFVNNAGIIRDGLLIKVKDGAVVDKMSLAQWQEVIDVNLTGVFLGGREAAQRMVNTGEGGVIINISSISRHGNAGQSNYAAAKAGVAAMSVVWAKELGHYGIRVAAIAPGFIDTDILSSMRPDMLEKVLRPVPLGRAGRADEVAHAVQFIVENDYFTGRCLDLDGGLRL